MLTYHVWREGLAAGMALVAQASLPADLPGWQELGIAGATFAVLVWIIREERADKAAMRREFQELLARQSDGFKAAVERSADAQCRVCDAVVALDKRLEGLSVLHRIEEQIATMEARARE